MNEVCVKGAHLISFMISRFRFPGPPGRGKRAMENVFGKLQFTAHIATIPIHCLSSTIVHPLHRNLHIFPLKRQLKWKIQ